MDRTEETQKLLDLLRKLYEERLPFNRFLGLRFDELTPDRCVMRLDMREDLIGNPIKGILHGGVIATVLDAVGGAVASLGLLEQLPDMSLPEVSKRFARMGTIDLRVDFLRPGKGEHFMASGELLRLGKSIAVTRMEMQNETGTRIAHATAAYMLG